MAAQGIMVAIESIAYERDRQEFALGDTLDIKTGLILAALTFLAIETGDFLKSSITATEVVLQVISIVALIIGGAFAVIELWPRDYDREASPQKYLDWVAETDKFCEDYPDSGTKPVTIEQLNAERVKAAVSNVQTNLALNKFKSRMMFISFTCVIASFALNIATLITRLF